MNEDYLNTLRVDFTIWNVVGSVWGYKKLVRLPRKVKKRLQKSIRDSILKRDYEYLKSEGYNLKELPKFKYKNEWNLYEFRPSHEVEGNRL